MIEGHRVILRETDQSHSSKGIDAMFIHTLMGAEADALCGTGYGERSTQHTNHRNGYRHR